MPESGSEVVLVLTTVADVGAGERLVEQLVRERLIACGNLIPGLRSIYRWQGEIAREDEVLVLMKTVRARVDELFERVAGLHAYEVPELLAMGIDAGSAPYCRWVIDETSEVSR